MSRTSFGPQLLDSKITNLLKPLFQGSKKEFLIIHNLVKNWEEIVGKKYAKICYPKSINFTKSLQATKLPSQAKLTIVVYNSAAGFFLENNSEYLIEKIAALYGFKAIHKIIIKQEPKQLESIHNEEIKLSPQNETLLQLQIKDVANQDLADSLARLGRDIFSKK